MWLEVFLAMGAGVWIAVVLFVVSLCGAAKCSDEAMDLALEDAASALRTLSLEDAAAMLEITPHTLLAWEARYGFPTSSPSELRYNRSEVLALRDGLRDGVSVASAVAQARTRSRRRATATAQLGDRRGGGLAS